MAAYFVSEPMQRDITSRKRKELGQLDQVNHDLSDFSLSSPATKIRRLDAQLPPILEEDEVEIDPAPNHEMNLELDNQERAIVPFNPVKNPMLRNPSNVSISLSPDLVSGFKDHYLRSSYHYGMKSDNQCTAVVTWVPSQLASMPVKEVSQSDDGGEPMEDEDMGAAAMEVEESSTSGGGAQGTSNGYGGGIWAGSSEGFLQWQQQHCMIPQPPQNITTPITWLQ
ncbi:uncharacterized protein LOC126792900 [Argentina anserina]|uniref:uncharacterized protein LOC126792900 n=1 Tax=Argentina anserina TaxID=57926 RepID=UPI0021763720|nr:uncharacterized protein LOC126792900 [Potentilla anserina]